MPVRGWLSTAGEQSCRIPCCLRLSSLRFYDRLVVRFIGNRPDVKRAVIKAVSGEGKANFQNQLKFSVNKVKGDTILPPKVDNDVPIFDCTEAAVSPYLPAIGVRCAADLGLMVLRFVISVAVNCCYSLNRGTAGNKAEMT